MPSFDSFFNVDEWISDYYLTTDETKGGSFGKRAATAVRNWKNQNGEAGHGLSPWERIKANRNELHTATSLIDPENPESFARAAAAIRATFGYPQPQEMELHDGRDTIRFTGGKGYLGSVLYVDAQPLAAIEALSTLMPLDEVCINGKAEKLTIPKLLTRLFLVSPPPAFVVVTAGTFVILAERESWPLGRYLAIDVALAAERNDQTTKGELVFVTAALAAEHIEKAADGTTWWADTIDESRDHAVKVSEGLREAIKDCIEIIGNDVLLRHRQQGLDTSHIEGRELGNQALRYLYRILFLLFAETTPELNILPVGVREYEEGYGITRLREQILREPPTAQAAGGTYLYDSLSTLFHFVNAGHDPHDTTNPSFDSTGEEGLTFRNLAADLFQSEAISYLSRVKLSNEALHRVLENLLLTPENSGRERGFVSYATLGVTQLGQVYEGLMSFTGLIATQEMLEVAPKGNLAKGSWLVTQDVARDLPEDAFVTVRDADDQLIKRRYRPGDFVYRQSSRDRERSASFYTPPVLTSFVAEQAIEELQETGRISCADDILTLKICEPAIGSGAFAVEAVNQLAELYLAKKQDELGERIPPEKMPEELQKVKASIALHQVYGVDLNRTAVELAEISLWLDTMSAELKAPWFGLRLRHGNSLIGSTRATVPAQSVSTKAYLEAKPQHHPLTRLAETTDNDLPDTSIEDRVYQFLLPSLGWGSAVDSADLKKLMPEEVAAMKAWRKKIQVALNGSLTEASEAIDVEPEPLTPTESDVAPQQSFSYGSNGDAAVSDAPTVKKAQKQKPRKPKTQSVRKLLELLTARVDRLWQLALVRMRIAEDQVSRSVTVWGTQPNESHEAVTREQIENDLLGNPDSAYHRLRLVMDAWNALWFWPLNKVNQLPDMDEWLRTLRDILGGDLNKASSEIQKGWGLTQNWDSLTYVEALEFNAMKYDALLDAHPWLHIVQEVAKDQAFFHWELDFAPVMAAGGFDLQLGNPPWVRPTAKVDALYSEHDPWFSLAHKPTQAQKKERREALTNDQKALATVSRGLTDTVGTAAVLRDPTRYPHLVGQKPDLYRGFMERTWMHTVDTGVISIIHPESHFTEEAAAALRGEAYRRLRRHWQFINELTLFDITHHVKYGVHLYGRSLDKPHFLSAVSLYHPQTVVDSLRHDGTGPLPGLKDDHGNWDVRPHKDRIVTVDMETLNLWHSILEKSETPVIAARTVYTVNTEVEAVLAKMAQAPRVKELGLRFSRGWNETTHKQKGYFDTQWSHSSSWDDVILQGPHLGVSTPMIKQPNETLKSNLDWTEIDLEALPVDFIPATAYAPDRDAQPAYDVDYGTCEGPNGPTLVADHYRVAWRRMAAATGFRTLYPALIPPGAKHVHTVESGGSVALPSSTALCGATLSAFLTDFYIRSLGTSDIHASIVESLPIAVKPVFTDRLVRLYLRLNCLTTAYAPLWEEITGEPWTAEIPLRVAKERWHAQNEIDAIVALSLDVTIDELCMIYRTQFPVMRRYDSEWLFDSNGRRVPSSIVALLKKLKPGQELSVEERTVTHPQSGVSYTYEFPFEPLDREADLRAAYARYEKEL